MAIQSGKLGGQNAVSAAVRRFPQFELAIHRLMDRNESFRDMCEELVEAELALSSVELDPPGLRAIRQAEWQELVDRWLEEIGTTLLEDQLARQSSAKPGQRR